MPTIHGFSGLRQPTQQDFEAIRKLGPPGVWLRAGVGRPEWAAQYDAGFNMVGNLGKAAMRPNQSFGLEDWKAQVTELVRRYPRVAAWEVWNEPYLPGEFMGYMDGTPQHYFELLSSAHDIIKAANPSATVIAFGGLNLAKQPQCLGFVQQVNALGGLRCYDAFSIHVYPGGNTDPVIQRMRAGLLEYGGLSRSILKPIWITETAASSRGWPDQGKFMDVAYPIFDQIGTVAVFWFTLRDVQDPTIDNTTWGLLDTNGTPKPGFSSFAKLASTQAR
jgi:hypothetical protein